MASIAHNILTSYLNSEGIKYKDKQLEKGGYSFEIEGCDKFSIWDGEVIRGEQTEHLILYEGSGAPSHNVSPLFNNIREFPFIFKTRYDIEQELRHRKPQEDDLEIRQYAKEHINILKEQGVPFEIKENTRDRDITLKAEHNKHTFTLTISTRTGNTYKAMVCTDCETREKIADKHLVPLSLPLLDFQYKEIVLPEDLQATTTSLIKIVIETLIERKDLVVDNLNPDYPETFVRNEKQHLYHPLNSKDCQTAGGAMLLDEIEAEVERRITMFEDTKNKWHIKNEEQRNKVINTLKNLANNNTLRTLNERVGIYSNGVGYLPIQEVDKRKEKPHIFLFQRGEGSEVSLYNVRTGKYSWSNEELRQHNLSTKMPIFKHKIDKQVLKRAPEAKRVVHRFFNYWGGVERHTEKDITSILNGDILTDRAKMFINHFAYQLLPYSKAHPIITGATSSGKTQLFKEILPALFMRGGTGHIDKKSILDNYTYAEDLMTNNFFVGIDEVGQMSPEKYANNLYKIDDASDTTKSHIKFSHQVDKRIIAKAFSLGNYPPAMNIFIGGASTRFVLNWVVGSPFIPKEYKYMYCDFITEKGEECSAFCDRDLHSAIQRIKEGGSGITARMKEKATADLMLYEGVLKDVYFENGGYDTLPFTSTEWDTIAKPALTSKEGSMYLTSLLLGSYKKHLEDIQEGYEYLKNIKENKTVQVYDRYTHTLMQLRKHYYQKMKSEG